MAPSFCGRCPARSIFHFFTPIAALLFEGGYAEMWQLGYKEDYRTAQAALRISSAATIQVIEFTAGRPPEEWELSHQDLPFSDYYRSVRLELLKLLSLGESHGTDGATS